MAGIASPTGKPFEPTGTADVYVLPIELLLRYAPPWIINDRPVRAWAPHPERDDLVYVTTDDPERLALLPEAYVELD